MSESLKGHKQSPILVYPGYFGIGDLLAVWTLKKKEQQEGVYS